MNYNVLKSNMPNSELCELYWNENGYLEIHDKFTTSWSDYLTFIKDS